MRNKSPCGGWPDIALSGSYPGLHLPTPLRVDAVSQHRDVLASLLPVGTASIVLEASNAHIGALWPAELDQLGHVVPKRRREFAGGRLCARIAIGSIGGAVGPILIGPGGEPVWPQGITGSITHSSGLCAAAAALERNVSCLGIDCESIGAVDESMREMVLRSDERSMLIALEEERSAVPWLAIAFSAKEAAWKAIFPRLRQQQSFNDIRVTVLAGGNFVAVQRNDPCGCATDVKGRYVVQDGLVWTAAWSLALTGLQSASRITGVGR